MRFGEFKESSWMMPRHDYKPKPVSNEKIDRFVEKYGKNFTDDDIVRELGKPPKPLYRMTISDVKSHFGPMPLLTIQPLEYRIYKKWMGVDFHEEAIETALQNGLKVPEKVLNDFPEMKKAKVDIDRIKSGDLSKTVLHGTTLENSRKILKDGFSGKLGKFTQDMYDERKPHGRTYFARPDKIQVVFNAIRKHVGDKLGKFMNSVTVDEMVKHGAILAIRSSDAKLYGFKQHGQGGRRGLPYGVEPGDITFKKGKVPIADVVTGERLRSLIEKHD